MTQSQKPQTAEEWEKKYRDLEAKYRDHEDQRLQAEAELAEHEPWDVIYTEQQGMALVGKILQRCRKAEGVSQIKRAKELGYDRANFVSMIEKGTSKLPFEKIGLFAEKYYPEEPQFRAAITRLIYPDHWDELLWNIEQASGDLQYLTDTMIWIYNNK